MNRREKSTTIITYEHPDPPFKKSGKKKTDVKEILGGILGAVVLVAIVYGVVAIWG